MSELHTGVAKAPAGLPPHLAEVGRTLVLGVLNVTPDSFSDGGTHADLPSAVAAGRAMVAAGADMVDVGGESTRPGAQRVSAVEERRRVLPVVAELADHGIPVSIDTMRADVANAAVSSGACLINDVSGGLADRDMLATVACLTVPYVVMHWRGHGWYMDENAHYDDVVSDVTEELEQRLHACDSAGITRTRVIVDPGIGFAKKPGHNWALLHQLHRVQALGRPVLLGVSRKRFLGSLLADETGPRPIAERESATVAATTLAAAVGVWAVRVHDVLPNADAVRVARAWATAGAGASG